MKGGNEERKGEKKWKRRKRKKGKGKEKKRNRERERGMVGFVEIERRRTFEWNSIRAAVTFIVGDARATPGLRYDYL